MRAKSKVKAESDAERIRTKLEQLAEKAKAEWIEQYRKNPAEHMFNSVQAIMLELADLRRDLEEANPGLALRRYAIGTEARLEDIERRLEGKK